MQRQRSAAADVPASAVSEPFLLLLPSSCLEVGRALDTLAGLCSDFARRTRARVVVSSEL